MKNKIVFLIIILLTSFASLFAGDDFVLEDVEAESLDIEGNYRIDKDKGVKFVTVSANGVAEMIIDEREREHSLLWMRARVSNKSELDILLNGSKVEVDNAYYFRWIKLGEFDLFDSPILRVESRSGTVEIDSFYITKPGIVPFNGEYAIDDLKADIGDEGSLKIRFNGQDLRGAEVTLYRKMTSEAYIKYIKNNYNITTRSRVLHYLSKFFIKQYEKVGRVKIGDELDYTIIDKEPLDGYECYYYLQIENEFGESLKSKKLAVRYSATEHVITESHNSSRLEESYSFERDNNVVELQKGALEITEQNKKLYINDGSRIVNVPSFLQGSFYYKGMKQSENVTFNSSKNTDIYLYLADFENVQLDYYFSKGFSLLRIPEEIGSESRGKGTYLFYKQYRAESGDALYIANRYSSSNNNSPFSLVVEGDDLLIYFDAKVSELNGSDKIGIKWYDDDDDDDDDDDERYLRAMQRIDDNVWRYRIKDGAEEYEDERVYFSFYNREGIELHDENWYWELYSYISQRKVLSNVVFFKELNEEVIDVNYSSNDHSKNEGLNNFLIDDGQLYSKKNNGHSYGFSEVIFPQKSENVSNLTGQVKREYITLSAERANEWTIEVENGIYHYRLLLEKGDHSQDAIIELNGKTYLLDESYNGLFELRDSLTIINNRITIENSGKSPLKLFAYYLKQDKSMIGKGHLPILMERESGQSIEESRITFGAEEVIRADFELDSLGSENSLKLIFSGATLYGERLYLGLDNSFEEHSLIAVLELTEDMKSYTVELSSFLEQIRANNNMFTIYIKGGVGTSLVSHKGEAAPLMLQASYRIEEGEPYLGFGSLSYNNGFLFTEEKDGTVYPAESTLPEISGLLNMYVMVRGYIKDDTLHILSVQPIVSVESISGDIYSNKDIFTWDVTCNRVVDGLRYRIQGVTEWQTVYSTEISRYIPEDGDYILEVVPMLNGMLGNPYSMSFIVDRTGPELFVTESIPDYGAQSVHDFRADYVDNYTPFEEISLYYLLNGESEQQILPDENGFRLTLPEGELSLEIYAKDELGNIGQIYRREVVVDLTSPLFDLTLSNTTLKDTAMNERIILSIFDKSDNLTGSEELIVHYMIEGYGEWSSTNEPEISFSTAPFDDGTYTLTAYVEDRAGLKSDNLSQNFVVDTIPVEPPSYYNVKAEGGYTLLSWESRADDPTFSHYKLRRVPEFKIDGYDSSTFDTGKNEFKDVYSLFNPTYKYYVSVVDIYGNRGGELECSSIKTELIEGSSGEEKTVHFEDSSLTFVMQSDSPLEVGALKINPEIDKNIQGDYNFINSKIYYLGPSGTTFESPALWQIELSDLTGDVVNEKDNLTVYYYNEVRNYWEEVETVYNSRTDKLEAGIKHFSTYAVGRKKDNKISVGDIDTSISPADGSLTSIMELFTIPSHQDSFALKLKFNSNRFNSISKFAMSEEAKSNGKKIKVSYKYRYTSEAIDKIDQKASDIESNLQFGKITAGDLSGAVLDGEGTILDYADYVRKANTLDSIWELNIPELISDRPDGEGIFKYIKFEDGTMTEIKSHNGEYRNSLGKRFIFKTLKESITEDGVTKEVVSGYLVKTEMYKNYKFNQLGQIEQIFYSNSPSMSPPTFSFSYNENNRLESINSHNRQGEVVAKIKLAYTFIKDVDSPTDGVGIFRISRITKESKVGDNFVPLAAIDLNYSNLSDTGTNSYLLVYNQKGTDNSSLLINYENLASFNHSIFDQEGNLLEAEEKLINYGYDNTQYDVVNKSNKNFPYEKTVEITSAIQFYRTGFATKTTAFGEPVDMKLPINFFDSSFTGNSKVRILTNISIDEKDRVRNFSFDNYKRIDNWGIFAASYHNYCTEENVIAKDKTGVVVTGSAASLYYHYKENGADTLTPFEKSMKIVPNRVYSLDNRTNHTVVNSRSFKFKSTTTGSYSFEESSIDGIFGIIGSRTGLFRVSSYDNSTFSKDYFASGDGSLELEDIVGNELSYKREYLVMNGNKKLIEMAKTIKPAGADKEKVLQRERYDYDGNLMKRKYSYISADDYKLIDYEYKKLSDYAGTTTVEKEEEEFLFTQVESIREQVDDGLFKVQKNYFDRNPATAEVQITKRESYYDSDPAKKSVKLYHYDSFNRPIKEEELIRNVDNGLKGKTSDVVYDELNRKTEITLSGETKLVENDRLVDGVLGVRHKKYYDRRTNLIIAEERCRVEDYDNREVTLHFYDNFGENYKTVALFYMGGVVREAADVLTVYRNKPLTGELAVSGTYNRVENASDYTAYYNNILNDSDYSQFQVGELTAYKDELLTLSNSGFAFENAGVDILAADQVVHYFDYELLKEEYLAKVNQDGTKNITKRFATFEIDSLLRKLNKQLDNIGSYLKYEWQYDDFSNVIKEIHPDNYLPPIEYSTVYDNYQKEVTEKSAGLARLSRYNSLNYVIFERIFSDDGSVNSEFYYQNNLEGKLKKRIGTGGVEEKFYYDYFGLVRSTVENSLEGYPVENRSVRQYNVLGKNIYTFSELQIRGTLQVDANWLESNWLTKDSFDDFGNRIKRESKTDSTILAEGEVGQNAIVETAYNRQGKPLFTTSNRYKVNSETADDLLADIKYRYDIYGNLVEKISYGWNPVTESPITYIETIQYDRYKRLKSKESWMHNGAEEILLSKTVINDVDQDGNVLKAYTKERGKNWVEVESRYNNEGQLEYQAAKVTDIAGDTFAPASNYILIQKKYALYDKYSRLLAEVNFDKTARYIEYNERGDKVREYSGTNFKYSIVNDRITNVIPGSPLEFEYNDSGSKKYESVTSQSGELLYEKSFGYDRYGRLTSESINRYDEGEQKKKKKKLITFNPIGNTETIITDEVTETVLQRGTLTEPKIMKYTLNNGVDSRSYTTSTSFSKFGNIIETTDRDGYRYFKKYDIYGNVVKAVKERDGQNIAVTVTVYDGYGINVREVESYSELYSSRQAVSSEYDKENRLVRAISYDYIDGVKTETVRKNYLYNSDGRLSSRESVIEGESYTIGYEYSAAGALKKKIYPDGKEYVLNYDEVDKDGSLAGIDFDNHTVIREIEYQSANSPLVKSYLNRANIKTTLLLDELNRTVSKRFADINSGKTLTQNYGYDKSGNISSIDEIRDGSSLTASTFKRKFFYDSYNRLSRAEYRGAFTHKINPKLSYKNFDYRPQESMTDYYSLSDDSDRVVNIESSSPSILISDGSGNELELEPDIIRIYKKRASKLKDVMINPLYKDSYGYQFLEDSHYSIENSEEYFEINNWDIDLTKVVKINFDLDNLDADLNPVADSEMEARLSDIVEFYTRVDGITTEYGYDVMGNRVSEKEEVSRNEGTLVVESREDNYIYSSDKRLLLSDNLYSYEYDLNGYLIKKSELNSPAGSEHYWSYKWGMSGNLREVEKYENGTIIYSEQHIYDEEGRRIKKITPEETVIYLYEGNDLLFEKSTSGTVETVKSMVYALGSLQEVITREKGILLPAAIHHSDIINSTRFITNENGLVQQENLFKPFGEELLKGAKKPGTALHYQYAGHDAGDDKTGLTYMISRWMDSRTGRFITPDSKRDGINHYVYAHNNPTTFIDPDGNIAWFIPIIVGAIIGAVVGMAIGMGVGGYAAYKKAQNMKTMGIEMPASWYAGYIMLGGLAGAGIGGAIGATVGAVGGINIGISIPALALTSYQVSLSTKLSFIFSSIALTSLAVAISGGNAAGLFGNLAAPDYLTTTFPNVGIHRETLTSYWNSGVEESKVPLLSLEQVRQVIKDGTNQKFNPLWPFIAPIPPKIYDKYQFQKGNFFTSLGDIFNNTAYPDWLVYPAGYPRLVWTFTNQDGDRFKVQVWKGAYPWGKGAEVGVYKWYPSKYGNMTYSKFNKERGFWMPYTTERGAPEFTIEMELSYTYTDKKSKKTVSGDMFKYSETGTFWITAFRFNPEEYGKFRGYDMNLKFRITGLPGWDDYMKIVDEYKPKGYDTESRFVEWKAGRYEILGDYTIYHQNIWRKRGKIE